MEKLYIRLTANLKLFFNSLVSLLKIVVRSRVLGSLPSAKKENCAVLGNGPSLRDSLEKNQNFIKEKCEVICVNHFAQSEYFKILKPDNYILLDEYFFIFDNDKYNRWDMGPSFTVFKAIDWPINMYLPTYARNSYLVNTIVKNNSNIKVCYFNHVVIEGYNWFKFPIFKRGLGMPQCQSVLGASIYLSINRRFKNIYVFGADHSWHENITLKGTNGIEMVDRHFYDKKGVTPTPVNLPESVTIASFFLSLYKTFSGYYVINKYAEYRNVKVYNASPKTYIDAFEKIKI